MSFMFEVLYKPPGNPLKESAVTNRVKAFGGRLDYREEAAEKGLGGICLTYEFDDFDMAIGPVGLRPLRATDVPVLNRG